MFVQLINMHNLPVCLAQASKSSYSLEIAQPDQFNVWTPVLFMYIAQPNPVYCYAPDVVKLISVTADSAKVMHNNYQFTVEPLHAGTLHVTGSLLIKTATGLDTVTTVTAFTAVEMPDLSLNVISDTYHADSTIVFELQYTQTGLSARQGYVLLPPMDFDVYDAQGVFLGDYMPDISASIEMNGASAPLHAGNVLKTSFAALDLRTGLVTSIRPFTYVVK